MTKSNEILFKDKQYVTCPGCFKIMASFWRHHYHHCSCPAECMIDGGQDYTRYGVANAWPMPKIEVGDFIFDRNTGKYRLISGEEIQDASKNQKTKTRSSNPK